MTMPRPALLIAALLATAPAAAQPSFDCAGEIGAVEAAICADPRLAALDRRLAARYAQAVAALKKTPGWEAATADLRATQRGWVKGRDECWKAADLGRCVAETYLRRESELVALYLLEGPRAVTFWSCGANPADEVVVYFFNLERPAVRLERGDTVDAGILVPAASGAKYEASFGRGIWIKGDEAILTWPEGETHRCARRRAG